MRGINKSVILGMAAAHAAAYAANASQQISRDMAEQLVMGAQARIIMGDGVTVKQMAKARTRDGRLVYVPSRKWADRSRYPVHQGPQEMARRVRQGVAS